MYNETSRGATQATDSQDSTTAPKSLSMNGKRSRGEYFSKCMNRGRSRGNIFERQNPRMLAEVNQNAFLCQKLFWAACFPAEKGRSTAVKQCEFFYIAHCHKKTRLFKNEEWRRWLRCESSCEDFQSADIFLTSAASKYFKSRIFTFGSISKYFKSQLLMFGSISKCFKSKIFTFGSHERQ